MSVYWNVTTSWSCHEAVFQTEELNCEKALTQANKYENCPHDASTRQPLYIPHLSESNVTCDVSEPASPLGSEQDRIWYI